MVAKSVKGEEEIPGGTVAVLTPDMPDVLSHVSVRARNSKVNINNMIFFNECYMIIETGKLLIGRFALLHVLIPIYCPTYKPLKEGCCA